MISPLIIQINRELQQAKQSIVNGVNTYIEGLEVAPKQLPGKRKQCSS